MERPAGAQSAADGRIVWLALALVMAVNGGDGLVHCLCVLVCLVSPPAKGAPPAVPPVPWPMALVVAGTLAAAGVLFVVPGPVFSVIP